MNTIWLINRLSFLFICGFMDFMSIDSMYLIFCIYWLSYRICFFHSSWQIWLCLNTKDEVCVRCSFTLYWCSCLFVEPMYFSLHFWHIISYTALVLLHVLFLILHFCFWYCSLYFTLLIWFFKCFDLCESLIH